MEYCHPYSDAITKILHDAVQDADIEQYIHDRAYSICLNTDENPGIPFVTGFTDEPPGTVPATDDPEASPMLTPEHIAACRKDWPKSYDVTTDTVKRPPKWRRVKCPVP